MAYFYVFCSKNISTNLVGHQQPTCLCVKTDFVVGTISLSCELYSLSWSCFRSCRVGIIVYGKWCFVSHVQCCGSCMVSTTGVRGGGGSAPSFFQGKLSFCRTIFSRSGLHGRADCLVPLSARLYCNCLAKAHTNDNTGRLRESGPSIRNCHF